MNAQAEPDQRAAWKTPAAILGVLGLIVTLVSVYLANRPEPANPPGETASVSVSPSSGVAGTGFLLSVSGFEEGETVRIFVDGVAQHDIPGLPSSGYSGIPLGGLSEPGRDILQVEGLTSQRNGSTIVNVR